MFKVGDRVQIKEGIAQIHIEQFSKIGMYRNTNYVVEHTKVFLHDDGVPKGYSIKLEGFRSHYLPDYFEAVPTAGFVLITKPHDFQTIRPEDTPDDMIEALKKEINWVDVGFVIDD